MEAVRAGRDRIAALAGRTVLIVDDGVATGSMARAACRVGEPGAIAALRRDADEVVCLAAPAGFTGVGQWYHRFGQVSDGEVADLLGRFPDHPASGVSSPAGSPGRP
ncbi:hypothetical protein [Amycolatopsis thermoflava]|uniref:hypothetical protein n=1 Tax=Amycolatopsis thermoflava TaxID=84480 RepID=UPI003664238C